MRPYLIPSLFIFLPVTDQVFPLVWSSCSQCVVPRPEASASPGNLLEIQLFGLRLRPTELEALMLGPGLLWLAHWVNQVRVPIWALSRALGFPGSAVVKTLPGVQQTWVQSLGWKDPLGKGMATHSSILCLENSMDRGAWQAIVHGVARVRHDWVTDTAARALCLAGLDSVQLWVSYFCPVSCSFIQRIFIEHLFTRHSHALGYICNASYVFCI